MFDAAQSINLLYFFSEYLPICNENTSRDSLSNVKVSDSILPLDEVFSSSNRNAQSGGFVTKRKKRSTVSHSSTVSKKSEANQTRSSINMSSSPGTHWEMNTDVTILPSEHTGFSEAEKSSINPVLQEDGLSTTLPFTSLSQGLDTDQSSNAGGNISKVLYKEQAIKKPNQPEFLLKEESDHDFVDGYVAQEKTVYETDMEMTSSECASIIAVLPKNNTQASKNKSSIPVKQTGTLRKVKSVREKNKTTACSLVQQVSNKKGDPADKSVEDLISDGHDRRTYVLPGPAVQERFDIVESRTQSHLEVSPCGESFSNNTIVLHGGKSELAFALEKDHCTEAGSIADMVPKKRKSKNIKEVSNMESSKKKKRKIHKNSKVQEQAAEENASTNESTEHSDGCKEVNTIPIIQNKSLEPKIRRETYVVNATKHHLVANNGMPKVVNYRRETFVISKPNPLVSVTLNTSPVEEGNDTFVEPQTSMNSIVPTDVSCKNENRSVGKKLDSVKEHCNPPSDPDDACDYKKQVSRHSEKKAPSSLFSELDKRKTHILPSKQDDLRGDKATLVQESFMNLTASQSNEASKFPYIATNKNDSFTLDMVSESILDHTMEFSSFAEFPSATNPDSTFAIDMSLKSFPELPVSEHCNKECSQVSNHINDLDENDNGHQQDTYETEIGANRQCKVEDQSMEINETGTCRLYLLSSNPNFSCMDLHEVLLPILYVCIDFSVPKNEKGFNE